MDTQTFLKEFGWLVEAPNGIQKLKGLILELAIQGKLGTQNSQDEPAQMLYQKIQLQKNHKQKKSNYEISEENPYEIPDNWLWTNLFDIGAINPTNETINDDLEVSFIPMPLISAVYGEPVKSEIKKWGEIRKGYTHFREGDIVLAKITPCFQNGKSTVMKNLINGVGAGTTELHVFRPVEETIVAEYILIYLKSPRFISEGIPRMTGTAGQKRVPKDYFAFNPFPLPPLEEQKRIVEKVAQLMALCDQLEAQQQEKRQSRININTTSLAALTKAQEPEDLKHAWQRIKKHFGLLYDTPETIPQLRQAILQLAVQGKLVPQDPNDESVHKLLLKCSEAKKKSSKTGKKSVSESLPTTDIPFECPSSWAWARLIDIFDFIDYRGKTPVKTDAGIRLITAKNVRMGFIKEEPYEYISEDTYKTWMTRGFPRVGDILFTTEAPLGNVAPLLIEEQIALAQRVINLQPYHSVDTQYYIYALMSPPIQDLIISKATGMTAQGIKSSKLQLIPIPIPPVQEQSRIVEKVNQLMVLCDQLKSELQQAEIGSNQLLDAMIHHVINRSTENSIQAPLEEIRQTIDASSLSQSEKQAATVAYIVANWRDSNTLGDIKVTKTLFLLQEHCNIPLGLQFKKAAAGPFDKSLYSGIHRTGQEKEWFLVADRTGGGHRYKLSQKAQEGYELGKVLLSECQSDVDTLMKRLAPLGSDHLEIIATLYAAWKDKLLQGITPSDQELLAEFYAWSAKKQQYPPDLVLKWLGWMRDYDIVPKNASLEAATV